MAESSKSKNMGCMVAVGILALVGALLALFWDDLVNPARGGSGAYKDYPDLVKRGVQSNSVRHKTR